jgi:hypothetical protein
MELQVMGLAGFLGQGDTLSNHLKAMLWERHVT